MPCNSDYMNANDAENNSKEVAEHIVYIASKMSLEYPYYIDAAAKDYYGKVDKLDEMTQILCSVIKNMSTYALNTIVYNGRCKKSRKLADWWDEHKKADEERIAKENEIKNENIILETALGKLTTKEKEVLRKMYQTKENGK